MSERARALDAQARARAQLEFDRPLVVEAGAGTGKTAVLTSRLVAWSLGPGWERSALRSTEAGSDATPPAIARDVLGRIAAITFTEAAAAEMAIRIERALEGVESGAREPWLDDAALPPEAVRPARAQALREQLDHLTVSTIHAWCRTLLARFPIAAGLHPDFAVDGTARAQTEALQRVLEQRLRAQYTTGGPLLELAELEYGPSEIYQATNALIDAGVRASDLDFDPLDPERVAALATELRAAFEALSSYVGEQTRLTGVAADVFPLIDQTLAALGEHELEDPQALERFVAELRERWDERADQLDKWGRATSTRQLSRKLEIPEDEFVAAAARAHAVFDVFRCLHPRCLEVGRRAFRMLLIDFEQELARRAVVTYADLLRGARDLLLEHPAIAGSLRDELELLLVDEFQDTDALQCDLVRALALDGPVEQRPSLFVVGDPKQSIYGWRNADLAAYGEFVRAIESAGGERLSLCVNFRSVPSVLAEVERVIEPVMQAEEGVQPGFEPLHASEALRGESGFGEEGFAAVEHWVAWRRPEGDEPIGKTSSVDATELEARAFAADVARLHDEHEVALGDIALLMRSRGDLERYLRALREAGVPYVVSGERSYFARREVVDAIAGLRCVLDPNDHVALVALIRSAAVGVPDAALIPLWADDFPRRAGQLHASRPQVFAELAERVRAIARRIPEDVPGIERIAGWEESLLAALAAIARLRESFARDAPDRFVERLRSELAIEASEAGRFPAAFRIANLERLYRELAVELAAGADEHALLRRLRSAAQRERQVDEPVIAVEDAVQVMTIHGAKGLGFEHVYLAQVHKARRTAGNPSKAIERVGDRLEYKLLGTATLGFAEAREERERRDRAEEVRTLYVALTRARRRLVIMGARAEGEPGELAKARSVAALLAHREEHPPLAERMSQQLEAGESFVDEGHARWRFLALGEPAADRARRTPSPIAWPSRVETDAIWQPLPEARREAELRMRRPRSGAASSAHGGARRDAAAGDDFEPRSDPTEHERRCPQSPLGRSEAMVVGTAVHALLEDWDVGARPDEELARQRARLPSVLAALGIADEASALSQALEIVDGFASSELFDRFTSLGERIVARELPVWLAADRNAPTAPTAAAGDGDDAPLESVAGSIDLVYRDGDGRLVVVDYKSDRVGSSQDLDARVQRYAPQGERYVRALAEGLALATPPRFELWFLREGGIATPLD
ncbi:MAG: UvrD-helicase domain-containing protein [Myxococcota bacterium]|nr:UvrD-helicase domain-containing protein [Myxococcota bacterium]